MLGKLNNARTQTRSARFIRSLQGRERGIGLIEILVAVVILSIGFLATARMQVQGVRASQEAYTRSQASFVLKDMADRMRSNPAGIEAGYYEGLSTTQNIQPSSCVNPGNTSGCSPAMIAHNDLGEWTRYFANPDAGNSFVPLLPSTATTQAFGQISLNSGIYTITVVWGETVDGEDVAGTLSVRLLP